MPVRTVSIVHNKSAHLCAIRSLNSSPTSGVSSLVLKGAGQAFEQSPSSSCASKAASLGTSARVQKFAQHKTTGATHSFERYWKAAHCTWSFVTIHANSWRAQVGCIHSAVPERSRVSRAFTERVFACPTRGSPSDNNSSQACRVQLSKQTEAARLQAPSVASLTACRSLDRGRGGTRRAHVDMSASFVSGVIKSHSLPWAA